MHPSGTVTDSQKKLEQLAVWGCIFGQSTLIRSLLSILVAQQAVLLPGVVAGGETVLLLPSWLCGCPLPPASPIPRVSCSRVWFCSPSSGFIASRSLCVCSLNERRLGEPTFHSSGARSAAWRGSFSLEMTPPFMSHRHPNTQWDHKSSGHICMELCAARHVPAPPVRC